MDFASLKRREMQAICCEHGLPACGSNADLTARLARALSVDTAATMKKMVGVVVGKGCLKRLGDGTSGVSSGAARKVTFVLEEKEEAGEAFLPAVISRWDRRRKQVEPRTITTDLLACSGVESHSNLANGEEEREVAGTLVGTRGKLKIQKNTKGIAANFQSGAPRRSMRKSSLSLVADSRVQSLDNPAEADKEGDVIEEANHMKPKQKTTRKLKLEETAVSGRGRQHKCTEELGGDFSAEGIAEEVGADARVMRSRRNAVSLSAYSGVESQDIPANAEEVGKVVCEAVDSKRKPMTRENAKIIAAKAHAAISCRSMRSSSLSADAVVLCPIVEKKKGRKKAGDCKDELGVEEKATEVQDLATAASPIIVGSKRSRRKEEECDPAVQKSAKEQISGNITRHSVKAAAALPIVENTRNKTKETHLDRELPTVLKSYVSRNDAPVTRSQRNRAVQINNTVLQETHIGNKLEKKKKPSGPAICRNQQFTSSVEEEEQVAALHKCPPLHENFGGVKFQNEEFPKKKEDVGKQQLVRRLARNRLVVAQT